MTFTRNTTAIALAGGLLFAMVGTGRAQQPPPDTSFSFQGQLEQNGAPVNDTCDFRFALRDAAEGGNQVGPTLLQSLDVRRGHFMATLDFGNDAFNEGNRWLATAVCCSSPCASSTVAADPMNDMGSFKVKQAPFAGWSRRVQTPTKLEQILAACSEETLTVKNNEDCCLAAITSNGGCGTGVYGTSTGNGESGIVGRAEGHGGIGVFGRSVSEFGYGVFGQAALGGYGGYFRGSDSASALAADTGAGIVEIGTLNIEGVRVPLLWMTNQGRIQAGKVESEVVETTRVNTGILQILGGSDVSEQFEVRPATTTGPIPGMVVCIDAAHEGELVVCSKSADPTVAGVISGAGGINPGMLLGQQGTLADGRVPIALSGRVYVLADASSAPIIPGDLLTTSATPGHAMKATDATGSRGVILGKAMTRLESGQGLVLVLVNLQ